MRKGEERDEIKREDVWFGAKSTFQTESISFLPEPFSSFHSQPERKEGRETEKRWREKEEGKVSANVLLEIKEEESTPFVERVQDSETTFLEKRLIVEYRIGSRLWDLWESCINTNKNKPSDLENEVETGEEKIPINLWSSPRSPFLRDQLFPHLSASLLSSPSSSKILINSLFAGFEGEVDSYEVGEREVKRKEQIREDGRGANVRYKSWTWIRRE